MRETNSKEIEVLADNDSEELKQASYYEMDDKHTEDDWYMYIFLTIWTASIVCVWLYV